MKYQKGKGDDVPNYTTKKWKYPINTMEVGEWILFPKTANYAAIRSSVHQHKNKTGKQFVTRMMTSGLKVWRTA